MPVASCSTPTTCAFSSARAPSGCVRVAFTSGSNSLAGNERLVVASRFSIMTGLPESLKTRIAAIPGVEGVGHENWFGGVYQDPKNFVFSF